MHICVLCGKRNATKKYRGFWACPKDGKKLLNPKAVKLCPTHRIKCGGKYGSCPSCLGQSMAVNIPWI